MNPTSNNQLESGLAEKLIKGVYKKYANGEYQDETRYEYEVGKYNVVLFTSDYFLEFVIYEKFNEDKELIVQLCYFRKQDKFSKQGNYQPLVKYLKSVLTIENLEKSV